MRRVSGLILAFATFAAACAGDTAESPTTTLPATTTTTAIEEAAVIEWDDAVVAVLTELEASNDGWTVETAMEAAALIRAELDRGVTEVGPVDIPAVATFLSEHYDDIPPEQWAELLGWEASGPARLVAFQTDEATRRVLQEATQRVDDEFESRTGHRLNVPFFVALSDYAKPIGLHAATFVADDRIEGFQFLFRTRDAFEAMADPVLDLAATSGEVCVIVFGQHFLEWGGDQQLAGMMHEVTHCHQNVVHPQGPVGFRSNRVNWMDEGYASWAGEAYVGGTPSSKPWWDTYFDRRHGAARDGFDVFTGSYVSYTFFVMLDRAGVDPWERFVPWFNGLRGSHVSDVERLVSMLGGANSDVVAGWTASATRNNDFGRPWNSENGPGVGSSTRSRNPTPQRVLGESTVRANEGEQRYRLMQVSTPPGEVSLITVSAQGLGTFRWQYGAWSEQFLVNGSYEQSWCVGEDCTCEDGTSPAPGVQVAPIQAGEHPDLHAAMFGAGRGAQLTVSVQTLEESCEEEPVATGPLDACLFGTWNPDPQQFQDLILTSYRSIPGISGITLEGTIDLTFSDDGTFSHVYNGVQGSGTVQGQTYEATWAGGTYGTWEATGGLLTLHFTGTDITVKVGPSIAQAPPIPTESVDAPYDCGSTHIQFDPPELPGGLWPLPVDWIKLS